MALSRRSFGFNLLMVLAACAALYVLLFTSLGWITKHGAELKVPKLVGRDIRPAVAEAKRLGFSVSIDSSYDSRAKPLAVLAQQPSIGAVVKRGRTLFLTINRAEPPMIPMPSLVGLTYRSATLILRSNHLLLGDTVHRPDFAEGSVLEQRFAGRSLAAGTAVPQGARIDLVIAGGLGLTPGSVPDVIGMPTEEAIATLEGNGLTYTLIIDGVVTDSALLVVYSQTPPPFDDLDQPSRILEGDVVDLRAKENPTPEEMEDNRHSSRTVDGSAASDDPKPPPRVRSTSGERPN